MLEEIKVENRKIIVRLVEESFDVTLKIMEGFLFHFDFQDCRRVTSFVLNLNTIIRTSITPLVMNWISVDIAYYFEKRETDFTF